MMNLYNANSGLRSTVCNSTLNTIRSFFVKQLGCLTCVLRMQLLVWVKAIGASGCQYVPTSAGACFLPLGEWEWLRNADPGASQGQVAICILGEVT